MAKRSNGVGRPAVPHPKKNITVRIDPRARRALAAKAKAQKMKLSELARAILENSSGVQLDPAA